MAEFGSGWSGRGLSVIIWVGEAEQGLGRKPERVKGKVECWWVRAKRVFPGSQAQSGLRATLMGLRVGEVLAASSPWPWQEAAVG